MGKRGLGIPPMEASRLSRARQAAPLGIQLSGPMRRTGTPRPGLGEPQWSQASLSLGVPFGSPSALDRVAHGSVATPATGSRVGQPSIVTSCSSGLNSEKAASISLVQESSSLGVLAALWRAVWALWTASVLLEVFPLCPAIVGRVVSAGDM